MNKLLTFLFISTLFITFSQENKKNNLSTLNKHSNINLQENHIINNEFISAWNIDQLNHIYIAEGSTITKYDSDGKVQFSQSIKSLGEISSIDVLNPLKICLFSKSQQKICFTDNTLTPINECISLIKYDLGYISNICPSNRQNKIWMWDSNNSKILQIDNVNPNKTISVTSNLNGIIMLNDPIFLREINNHLYAIDTNNKLYLFDIFGSLIENEFNLKKGEIASSNKNQIWTIKKESIYIYKEEYDKIFLCKLPEIEPISFEVNSNFFYIESLKGIHIYNFK